MKAHQLRYWLRKFEVTEIEMTTSTEWYSVDIDQQMAESNTSVIVKVGTMDIVKVGTMDIVVKPGFNPQLLIDVVRTLTNIC